MKTNLLILTLFLSWTITSRVSAEKIYLLNASGYNTAETQLINAIIANGHTVVVQPVTTPALPAGFTSFCNDSINGYDWLCFFGEMDYSSLLPQVKLFLDAGGKVFYQYEVGCCTNSSTGVAALLSGLTGLPITPNANSAMAAGVGANVAGWNALNIDTCLVFLGNAYKGLDGLPVANQFQSTSNLNGSSPPVSSCLNFGFHFKTFDFISTSHNGAITGLGDYNAWMDSGEPFIYGGTLPIDTDLVKYFFPNSEKKCYLFPPGCMVHNTTGIDAISNSKNTINIFPDPVTSSFSIGGITEHTKIQIMDLAGKILMNKIVNENESIDVSDLAKGVYILKTNSAIKMILKI